MRRIADFSILILISPIPILVTGTGVLDANCMKTGGGSKLTVSDRTSRFECPVATGWR